MSIFDGEKYQAAAERALQFIKNQLDVNHFSHTVRFAEEYGDYYEGDAIHGTAAGFNGSESVVPAPYISCSQYYDYGYEGGVSGSWQGLPTHEDYAVNVHVLRDADYKVITCPLNGDGSWNSVMQYREIYAEETVYYTLTIPVGEGVKEMRLATGLSLWK